MIDRARGVFQALNIGSDTGARENEKRRIILTNKIQRVRAVDREVSVVDFKEIWNAPGRSG